MRLVTAILARNEAGADRFLRQVLTRCLAFSDTVVLLDDRSTDATPTIARELGCVVETRQALDAPAWGSESSARRELWELGCRHATGPNDWLLIADADQELVGDIRALCRSRECNTWLFALYDCWSMTEYREDELWQGHLNPRPWLFAVNRVPEGWTPEWNSAPIHTGHAPSNWPMVASVAPPDSFYWLHWSYATPALRQKKHAQYQSVAHLMSPEQRRHAESILQ